LLFDPIPAGHPVSKPGELPLGVLPGCGLGQGPGGGEIKLAGMDRYQLAQSQDLGGRERGIDVRERCRLCHRAVLEHRVEARVDAAVKLGTRRRDHEAGKTQPFEQRAT
jgi:hypothetical protein